MQQYELGGVKFIIHEGEVYCRYSDVFEVEEETVDEPEEEPELPAKKNDKAASTIRKCGKCGKTGHQARTCPSAALVASNAEMAKERKAKALESHKDKVRRLVEKGSSDAEIYALMHDFMTEAEFQDAIDEARS